jgi:hypothetical protein
MPKFEVCMCHDFMGSKLWTMFPSRCNQGRKSWTNWYNLCKRKVQTKYSGKLLLASIFCADTHMVGTSPSMMDHLPPFSKRQIFQWSQEVPCPGRTRESRQQLERKSAKYPLAIIYSRVKFWVGTMENFNQPQLSLLPHGVHHPRRTTCLLFLNLSS